jgi:hypothetical protein
MGYSAMAPCRAACTLPPACRFSRTFSHAGPSALMRGAGAGLVEASRTIPRQAGGIAVLQDPSADSGFEGCGLSKILADNANVSG